MPTPIDPTADRYVLHGRVITMNEAGDDLYPGYVCIDRGEIVEVLPADGPLPSAWRNVELVKTGGTIYPGMIELHNHLSYNVLPLWLVPKRFEHRGQWADHPDKQRLVSDPMRIIARHGGTLEAIVRYVEAKCLAAGVTTSQGITLVNQNGIRRQYKGVVRNVEQPLDVALPAAATRIADVSNAADFKKRLDKVHRLLLHLAEGIGDDARRHFSVLRIAGTDWAISEALIGIHCAGLRPSDYRTFGARHGSMVWSPLSNLMLYGDTADVAAAQRHRTMIALGSDWSPTGSRNLLGELKVAALYNQHHPDGPLFTTRQLVEMVTVNPARMLGWGHRLGTVEPGRRADLVVLDNLKHDDPYRRLVEARENAVVLVVIDGWARYGIDRLMARFQGGTEPWSVGASTRHFRFDDPVADPVIRNLPLAEAQDRLARGLADLPQLATDLATPIDALLNLGVAGPLEGDGGPPARWVIDLEEDPPPRDRDTVRALAPAGFDPRFELGAEPGTTLQSIALDPLTVEEDPDYFAAIVAQPNLPSWVKEGLPGFWRRPVPAPPASVFTIGTGGDIATDHPGPIGLAEFLDLLEDPLSDDDRETLVGQARLLIEDVYVHLQHKTAMHAINPVQDLRILEDDLRRAPPTPPFAFHERLLGTFTGLRDLHTNYLLPEPYRRHTAYLPFLVEQHWQGDRRRYTVTKLADGFQHPTFAPGVTVTHWNGIPIEHAVRLHAQRDAGANADAAFARGLDSLTIRPLIRMLPPDEEWVTVGYADRSGRARTVRFDWKLIDPGAGVGAEPDESVGHAAALGNDLHTEAVNQAKKALFRPDLVLAERAGRLGGVMAGAGALPTAMPNVFRATVEATAVGELGVVRIFTFNVPDADEFVEEFARLAAQLPTRGLIVDVRNNGGGLITAAEQLLQTLTEGPIRPTVAQFVNHPLTRTLVEAHSPSPLDPSFDLSRWQASMGLSLRTGEVYSAAFPITGVEAANAVGRRYQGPSVLVTDARCYSATDMFAAGFKDHGIGPVLGVDGSTGGGGANVWTHQLLRILAGEAGPFTPLPAGAGYRVSVRRTLHAAGPSEGVAIEDLGVSSDARHRLTERDVMNGNPDLIERAASLLG